MLCVPFADPNAHGSIAGLSFRRRYGSIILEKKPVPVQPNSAGQIAQRNAFKTANNEWYALPSETRDYYNARGPVYDLNGRTLYIRQKLRNILPDPTPLNLLSIQDIIITKTIGSNPVTFSWIFSASLTYPLAKIEDYNNNFINIQTAPSSQDLILGKNPGTHPRPDVPMWYSIYIECTKWDTSTMSGLVRWPFDDVDAVVRYYVSEDLSLWHDSGYTKLACTPLF